MVIKQNMKNIHLISTDKPSRIYIILKSNKLGITSNELFYTKNFGSGTQNQHIYITSDEEIKANVYCLINKVLCKTELLDGRIVSRQLVGGGTMDICKSEYLEIILTTDQSLEGVQPIDNEFLEWFVKNPSCEEVEIEDWYNKYLSCCRSKEECYCNKKRIIIPQEEHTKQIKCYCGHTTTCDCSPLDEDKQETTLEEAAEIYVKADLKKTPLYWLFHDSFIAGAKWQQERMYSDMQEYAEFCIRCYEKGLPCIVAKDWFEQFKKK